MGKDDAAQHFFIVGAQRSGTTYLYHALDAHPEIEMARPVRPEPKFFLDDALYAKGLPFYLATYFSQASPARLRGEKSTSYAESEKVAKRISEAFPAAKILFLLRDPIARAVSHFNFSVQNGFEQLPIEEAFRAESARRRDTATGRVSVSPFAYLERGCYLGQLACYEKYFPRSAVKILIQEEFIGSSAALRDLYQFLGVAEGFHPTMLSERINASERDAPPLGPELRSFLRQYFAEPNRRLGTHLGVSLSRWWDTPD